MLLSPSSSTPSYSHQAPAHHTTLTKLQHTTLLSPSSSTPRYAHQAITTQATSQATPVNLPTLQQQHTHTPPHDVANLAQRFEAFSTKLDPQLQAPPLYHQQQ
ncbi:hypothetical protein Pcinc_008459 [Petrolisthes cinctipes]|uniref:Uncharacterized protein n=1 Tax=Petrolisthes cinctipes TaxID=88211 RepID=A0AAE1G778_PETCI|nr:hypothetical protein Pcinc_008459 [Petrolisthes cinctipes]